LTFQEIFNHFKTLVYNMALHYTNNVEDAEEVSQDVFIKIYKHMGSFKNHSELKTWIYRITVNQCLDFLKSKNRKWQHLFFSINQFNSKESYGQPINIKHPGIEIEEKEGLQQLMRNIYNLPEKQKTVLILLKIEGLSQKRVAEIMEIKEKAVESLFQRAKQNLKKVVTGKENK